MNFLAPAGKPQYWMHVPEEGFAVISFGNEAAPAVGATIEVDGFPYTVKRTIQFDNSAAVFIERRPKISGQCLNREPDEAAPVIKEVALKSRVAALVDILEAGTLNVTVGDMEVIAAFVLGEIAAEREACAKIADAACAPVDDFCCKLTAKEIGEAIRKRGGPA